MVYFDLGTFLEMYVLLCIIIVYKGDPVHSPILKDWEGVITKSATKVPWTTTLAYKIQTIFFHSKSNRPNIPAGPHGMGNNVRQSNMVCWKIAQFDNVPSEKNLHLFGNVPAMRRQKGKPAVLVALPFPKNLLFFRSSGWGQVRTSDHDALHRDQTFDICGVPGQWLIAHW